MIRQVGLERRSISRSMRGQSGLGVDGNPRRAGPGLVMKHRDEQLGATIDNDFGAWVAVTDHMAGWWTGRFEGLRGLAACLVNACKQRRFEVWWMRHWRCAGSLYRDLG
jgi:hypothetical protein